MYSADYELSVFQQRDSLLRTASRLEWIDIEQRAAQTAAQCASVRRRLAADWKAC